MESGIGRRQMLGGTAVVGLAGVIGLVGAGSADAATRPTAQFGSRGANVVYLQRRPTSWSLYRPYFFDGGIAVHGDTSVPPYAASHGCCRVSIPAQDMLISTGALVNGRRVYVY
ncbi:hypothetical protein [Flexivirga caeni]|uniref:hypothetical protein n=1 Tax=Flexivirga caeni TaxID=2294115 RepID=UPI0015E8BD58|nr:hypothetical protein [Flexivirga caeni]